MNREDARQYIKEHPEFYLERARRRGYICPICGNGKGTDGDGIEANPAGDGTQYKCFKCGFYGDIIDLIGQVEGISDDKDMFERAYDIYGIEIDKDNHITSRAAKKAKQTQAKVEDDQDTDAGQQATEYNFNEQIEAAHKALLDNPRALKHYTDRGISTATIERFKLGYAERGHNSLLEAYPKIKASDKTKQALYNYVFPYRNAAGDYVYFHTEISDRGQIDEFNKKYRYINNKGDMPKQCFNEYYITSENAGIIFLCEGVYDALAVEELGYRAIAGGTTGIKRILKICDEVKTDAFFIIALDNDDAGKMAIDTLKEGLDGLGIHYMLAPAAGYKDYNEALCADRDKFSAFIGEAVDKAAEIIDAETRAEREEYEATSAAERLSVLDDVINKTSREKAISTGFIELDGIIDDGIRAGLYIVGAVSSFGKTTLCLQIADTMASQGQDILYYSLEMSEAEIMAKSLSRESYIKAMETYENDANAKTTLGILNGRNVAKYGERDRYVVNAARDAYKGYAGHVHITEGIGDVTVEQIRKDAENHIRLTGRVPAIVIDYLQLIAPPKDVKYSMSDKQVVDKNVLELKRLSRTMPVIAISSFNRNSYAEAISLASFKESGSIEYSSDYLLGLQYSGIDDATDKERVEIAKTQRARKEKGQPLQMQLKVLKNRNGYTGSVELLFYSRFNLFKSLHDTDDNPFTKQEAEPEQETFSI